MQERPTLVKEKSAGLERTGGLLASESVANAVQRLLEIPVGRGDPRPVYAQISEGFRKVLSSGILPPGCILPPERVFCEHFGVSHMTLRQAYDTLEREGQIECMRGRGTFVAQPRVLLESKHRGSFTEEVLSRGMVPSSRLLSFTLCRPTSPAREFLALTSSDKVYKIERLRFGDGVPLALETVEVPQRLCPGLNQSDLEGRSLYWLLEERYGLHPEQSVEEISAVVPSIVQRRLLEIPRSVALLMIRRRSYTAEGLPVEWAVAAHRGDFYGAIVRSVRSQDNLLDARDKRAGEVSHEDKANS